MPTFSSSSSYSFSPSLIDPSHLDQAGSSAPLWWQWRRRCCHWRCGRQRLFSSTVGSLSDPSHPDRRLWLALTHIDETDVLVIVKDKGDNLSGFICVGRWWCVMVCVFVLMFACMFVLVYAFLILGSLVPRCSVRRERNQEWNSKWWIAIDDAFWCERAALSMKLICAVHSLWCLWQSNLVLLPPHTNRHTSKHKYKCTNNYRCKHTSTNTHA